MPLGMFFLMYFQSGTILHRAPLVLVVILGIINALTSKNMKEYLLSSMNLFLSCILGMIIFAYYKEKMDAFLSERQMELSKLSKETEYKLMLLETARKRLRKEQNMSFDVTIKTIPERYAATVQMVVPHYEDEGMLWNTMMSLFPY